MGVLIILIIFSKVFIVVLLSEPSIFLCSTDIFRIKGPFIMLFLGLFRSMFEVLFFNIFNLIHSFNQVKFIYQHFKFIYQHFKFEFLDETFKLNLKFQLFFTRLLVNCPSLFILFFIQQSLHHLDILCYIQLLNFVYFFLIINFFYLFYLNSFL